MLNSEDMFTMFPGDNSSTRLRTPVVNTQALPVQFKQGKQWAYVIRLPSQGPIRDLSDTASSSVCSTEEQRSNYHTPREKDVNRALNC